MSNKLYFERCFRSIAAHPRLVGIHCILPLVLMGTLFQQSTWCQRERLPERRAPEPAYRENEALRNMSPADREEVARRMRKLLGVETPEDKLRDDAVPQLRNIFREHELRTRLEGLKRLELPRRDEPDYVRWVQESLNRASRTKLKIDGRLTPETLDAIREFQRGRGLIVDGKVGPKTEAELAKATDTHPPVAYSSFRSSLRSHLDQDMERRFSGYEHFLDELRRMSVLFLDVKNANGTTSVLARRESLFGEPTQEINVSDSQELDHLIRESSTVVHRGDDLPMSWQSHLSDTSYLRNSDVSPKKTAAELIAAKSLLDHTAQPGQTRIFGALPQSKELSEMVQELRQMKLRPEEAPDWRELNEKIRGVIEQTNSRFQIQLASKESLLDEFRNGESDTLVIFAHFKDETLYLPDGQRLTMDELSSIQREKAPNRTIVLYACGAGTVNQEQRSLAETLLRNKIATNVVANAEPVSAAPIPDLLQRFLIDSKTIKEVFTSAGFWTITERLDYEPRPGSSNGYSSTPTSLRMGDGDRAGS